MDSVLLILNDYIFYFYIVYILNKFSNYFFIGLLILRLIILNIIFLRERILIRIFCNLLLGFCLLFFNSDNILLLFINLEIVTFLILFLLLFYGYQIEKISSSWYLMFLGVLTRIIILYYILMYGNLVSPFTKDQNFSWIIFILFFIRFFMKLPVFFLHIWLPKVHVESPTMGSVLLASLLLKLGGWGIIIFSFLGENIIFLLPLIFLGISICRIYCMYQRDGKSLIGYSSTVHMAAFIIFFYLYYFRGIFSSYLILISHGFISAVLFLYVGYFYGEVLNRKLYYHRGLLTGFLFLSIFIFIYFFINRGLPPFMGFISEVWGLREVISTNFKFILILLAYFIFGFFYSLIYGINIFLGKLNIERFFNNSLLRFIIYLFYGLLIIFRA